MNGKKRKKRLRTALIILALLLIIAGVAAYLIYSYAAKPYDGMKDGRHVGNAGLYIDARGGAEALRDSLVGTFGEDYGLRVYNIWEKKSDAEHLGSGYYRIEPGTKAYDIARRIINRTQTPIRVKFNNLRTIDQLAERIDAQMLIGADEFAAAADSVLSSRGIAKEAYPAYFLPDTYEMYWSDSAPKVVDRLLGYYDKFWTEERREAAAKLHLTPVQVSTLASIVEEETNKADERPKVARLYINRLDKRMKLQADPTVKFAVGDFSLRRILREHLSTPSPYNTYLHDGLPPGPIRLPEPATLNAVLSAPAHNYLYMCAKEDMSGYHNFATDFATHQVNAARYRKALDARGIK